MGSQLRWLERTPDKREVDGSIPFEPTNDYLEKEDNLWLSLDEASQHKINEQCKENEEKLTRQYTSTSRKFLLKFDMAIRSLDEARKVYCLFFNVLFIKYIGISICVALLEVQCDASKKQIY